MSGVEAPGCGVRGAWAQKGGTGGASGDGVWCGAGRALCPGSPVEPLGSERGARWRRQRRRPWSDWRPGASRAGGGALAAAQLHAPPARPGFSTNTEWGQRAAEPSSEQRPALHTTCAEALRVVQKDTGQSSGRAPSSGDVQSKLKPQGCECRRSPWSRPGGDSLVPRGQGLPFLPLPIPALPDLSPPLLRCLSVAPDTLLYRSAVYTLSCCSRRRLGDSAPAGVRNHL